MIVWKSAQHTRYRFAFCRFRPWLPFRRCTIPEKWARSSIPLRMSNFSFKAERKPDRQANLPSLGRHRHHSVHLFAHLYLHRSASQLSPRIRPDPCVSRAHHGLLLCAGSGYDRRERLYGAGGGAGRMVALDERLIESHPVSTGLALYRRPRTAWRL